jgi:adenylosuccinate synthase
VLDNFPKLKICVAYRVNEKIINDFPASISTLEKCEPVYEELEGWMAPTSDIRFYSRLPLAARRYLKRLEELCAAR